MSYISLEFYVFLAAALVLYYILPRKIRWFALLVASCSFYFLYFNAGWYIFLATILISYVGAILISRSRKTLRKILTAVFIILTAIPWLILKNGNLVWSDLLGNTAYSFIVPVGLSFYTVQIISYLVDVSQRKIQPQLNPLKYALFCTFFPQIIQGPIPRYDQLGDQLFTGHKFKPYNITRGFYLIIWGFFLKLVIAERCSTIYLTIFNSDGLYTGMFVWIAGIFNALNVYIDFLAATTLSQGVAWMFGIQLMDNFQRPFLSETVGEFWRRWHISFSSWLRDYIYFPLGGSRKGKLRKYINLLITFVLSGLWHAASINYIIWGAVQGIYQIVGTMTIGIREHIYEDFGIKPDNMAKRIFRKISCFFLFDLSIIVCAAPNLKVTKDLFKSMFTVFNPWILFDGSLYTIGVSQKEWHVLVISLLFLLIIEIIQEKNQNIRISDSLVKSALPIRWIVPIIGIVVVMVFGAYGYGFSSSSFVYGAF